MHLPSSLPPGTLLAETPICSVGIDPSVGNIPKLAFRWQGRTLQPLHRAPWVDDQHVPESIPAVDRTLSGDFVCAPFGLSDVEPAPPHGWSANSAWRLVTQGDQGLTFELERLILGATLQKHVCPSPDAPLLYQTHVIAGGEGGLTFAHHPMIRVTGGARLFTSPKRLAVTPDVPLVQGRHALATGSVCEDYTAVPAVRGGLLDVSRLPISAGDEDFIALVEAEGSSLGWTAVIRDGFDDIVFVLKDPRVLPLTMLWHSNGGRDDAPWNGRHSGVLGIEDGIAAGAAGHKAALGSSVFSSHNVPTTLDLVKDKTHRIAHVIGAVPRPDGWRAIADIRIENATMTLHDAAGQTLELPFDAGFFGG